MKDECWTAESVGIDGCGFGSFVNRGWHRFSQIYGAQRMGGMGKTSGRRVQTRLKCRRATHRIRKYMLPSHRPTSDEVLAILINQHRLQSQVDPEAETDAVLTFDSSIADWRSACDLLGWRGLGQSLNEEWGLSLSAAAWRNLLEPADRRNLRTLCETISRQAEIETLPEKGLLGCRSAKGRALRALRSVLVRLGMPRREIRAATPVAPLLTRYGWRFLSPCIRFAPGALSSIKLVGKVHGVLILLMAWLIIASICLALFNSPLAAWTLCLALVCILLFWIPHPLFRGSLLLPGIVTLEDLATCLATRAGNPDGGALNASPKRRSQSGAPNEDPPGI